jgi:hypothetical protein
VEGFWTRPPVIYLMVILVIAVPIAIRIEVRKRWERDRPGDGGDRS